MKALYSKLIFTVAILLLSFSVFAQTQLGFRLGFNMSNEISKDASGNKFSTGFVPGFHAGVTADIPIAQSLYFQPGLLFSTKGAKVSRSNGGVSVTTLEVPHFLELPLNVIYKSPLGNGNLLLGAGPYLAYGVGGKLKLKAQQTEKSYKLKFLNDYSSADSSLNSTNGTTVPYGKPLDLGVNALVGYEFTNQISAQLNGQLGLRNLAPAIDGKQNGGSFKNYQLSFSIGYKF